MRSRFRLLLLLVLGISWCAGWCAERPVRAQPAASGPKLPLGDRRLTQLLAQGQAALQRGDAEAAVRAFEDAFRYSPRPVLLYYLGKAAQLSQRGAAAVDLLRRFLDAVGEDVEPEVRAEVQSLISGYVTDGSEVSVQGEAGALLSVDGHLHGALPLSTSLLLPAGSHQLVLEKGKRRVETVVQILPRRQAEVRFTLTPPLALLTLTPGILLIIDPPTLEAPMRETLRRSISEAVQVQNAVLVTSEAQADLLQRQPELAACQRELRCQEEMARRTSAQFVLRLEVQREEPQHGASGRAGKPGKAGALRFSGDLLDVDVGMISVRGAQGCSDCGLKRALPQLAELVQELLRNGTARPRGKLRITSDPAGARIVVDNVPLGATPYERDTFIGTHEVVVSKPGYDPVALNLVVEDGKVEERSVPLVATQPVRAASTARIAKWSLLGAGIGAVVLGAALIAAGVQKDCPSGPASCVTKLPGATTAGGVFIGLGVIAGGLSGYFFVQDARGPSQTGLTASVGLGGDMALGGSVGLGARF
jgi:hypothetical protein